MQGRDREEAEDGFVDTAGEEGMGRSGRAALTCIRDACELDGSWAAAE